ncbi:MAG TPA: radical SAM protein [Candidatus Hydrogenedentes bacterium]|nr:radical SAM protein [Candidatus Hydrogenedentota bacterium]HRT21013.1 radical SAM protein [Candidatus Hydrogenedentota bacterium]HRT65842.1 radical SAM protein [Candidatus Hydrogenedentota bacterium]
MRVLFYDFDAGSLGIQSLLAVLKSSAHEVYLYLDCSCPRQYLVNNRFLERIFALTEKQICDDLLSYRAEVVCFSITSLTFARILGLIRQLKSRCPGLIVICGGVHATLLPDAVAQHADIDFVVTGEAEHSFPALLDALDNLGIEKTRMLEASKLPGVWNMLDGQVINRGLSPVPCDLNRLPPLQKELHHAINRSLSAMYSTVCMRGCFYSCTFCNDAAIRDLYAQHGASYYRVRSVDCVLAELRHAKERYCPKHIEFHDDVFAADREWLAEFSRRYPVEIGIPFNVQTHPLLLDDDKLEMIARSGCVTIEIGVQSACEDVRRDVLRRNETTEHAKRLLIKARALGMRVETDFIANLPGETPDHLRQMLEFIYETRPNLVNLHFLAYLPKTEITRIALETGALTPGDVQSILDEMRPFFPSKVLSSRYRVLAIELVMACAFSAPVARKINNVLDRSFIGALMAPLAPFVVVLARIMAGLFDRRAYLYRFQFTFGIRNMGRVLLRKTLGLGIVRPRLGKP